MGVISILICYKCSNIQNANENIAYVPWPMSVDKRRMGWEQTIQ